jgi:hypothetical protein
MIISTIVAIDLSNTLIVTHICMCYYVLLDS